MTQCNRVLMGLAAASVFAVGAYAQPPADVPPLLGPPPILDDGPGRLIPLLLHSTDLAPDQQTQVRQILEANRSAVEDILTNIKQANDDLTTLLLGSQEVQPDALAEQLATIDQLRQQLAQQEVNTILAIRGILAPDQLDKAAATKYENHAWEGGKRRPVGNGV